VARDHLYCNSVAFCESRAHRGALRCASLSPSFLLPFVPFYLLSPASIPGSHLLHSYFPSLPPPPRVICFSPLAMNEDGWQGGAERIPDFMRSLSISPCFIVVARTLLSRLPYSPSLSSSSPSRRGGGGGGGAGRTFRRAPLHFIRYTASFITRVSDFPLVFRLSLASWSSRMHFGISRADRFE